MVTGASGTGDWGGGRGAHVSYAHPPALLGGELLAELCSAFWLALSPELVGCVGAGSLQSPSLSPW